MRKLEIWMLDDGIPGHWSMTDGLVNLFSKICDVTPIRVKVSWRLGAVRQLLQIIEKVGIETPEVFVNLCVQFSIPTLASRPDFIISRGGGTLFTNAWLSRKYSVPNIFIGTLRGMPERLFQAVVLQRDDLTHAPYFQMPAFPTRIDPATLDDKAAEFAWTTSRPGSPTACMFLGGDGSGFSYKEADWLAIARGMIHLYEESGVRWCVSSSRRTPEEAEIIFRREIPEEAIHEVCWWHKGDRRPCMEAFLAVSNIAYCTNESMSMIEECINGCKPTITLFPPIMRPNAAFSEFLERRVKEGRIAAISIYDFEKHPQATPPGGWRILAAQDMEDSARRLLRMLEDNF